MFALHHGETDPELIKRPRKAPTLSHEPRIHSFQGVALLVDVAFRYSRDVAEDADVPRTAPGYSAYRGVASQDAPDAGACASPTCSYTW